MSKPVEHVILSINAIGERVLISYILIFLGNLSCKIGKKQKFLSYKEFLNTTILTSFLGTIVVSKFELDIFSELSILLFFGIISDDITSLIFNNKSVITKFFLYLGKGYIKNAMKNSGIEMDGMKDDIEVLVKENNERTNKAYEYYRKKMNSNRTVERCDLPKDYFKKSRKKNNKKENNTHN